MIAMVGDPLVSSLGESCDVTASDGRPNIRLAAMALASGGLNVKIMDPVGDSLRLQQISAAHGLRIGDSGTVQPAVPLSHGAKARPQLDVTNPDTMAL